MKRSRLRKVGRRGLTLKALDEWLRKVVIARDGKCVAEGAWGMRCGGPLQASHILPKGGEHACMRYALENVVAMCRSHHMFGWHSRDPIKVAEWANSHFGAGFIQGLRDISAQRRRGHRLDKELTLLYLKKELNWLGK